MKTGIHIKPCNISSAEQHNKREKEYLERLDASGKKTYDIFRDETHLNRSWVNPDYQGRTLTEILEDTRQEVKTKTGRAMQAKATPIREGVCPILPTTQIRDFQGISDWYKAHGATVIRIDLHHDEGYQDDTGNRKYNHHAHIIIDYIDHATGRSVKLSKEDISQLQKVVADSLGMERGTPKEITGKKHLDTSEYRELKANESARAALSVVQGAAQILVNIFDLLASLLLQVTMQEINCRNEVDKTSKRDISTVQNLPEYASHLEKMITALLEIISNLSDRYSDALSNGAKTGQIRAFIENMRESIKNQFASLKSLISAEKNAGTTTETISDVDYAKLGREAAEQKFINKPVKRGESGLQLPEKNAKTPRKNIHK